MTIEIALLPGDGIGPEVTAEAVRVLKALAQNNGFALNFTEYLIGGACIDVHSTALTDETVQACRTADAVMLGAVGGPRWDDPLAKVRPEQGLLRIRKELGVYANLRPVKVYPELVDASPLKPEKLAGVDLLVVRELTGGLYFGEPKERRMVNGQQAAVDTMFYSESEIRRIIELAFKLAKARRGKVTSVDKANVLETSRLWRQIAVEVGKSHPDVALEHVLVDTAAMRLINNPASFDVIVTENMFGDILTDEAAVLSGSMGLLPSASIGDSGPGLYEPIHGSAPDIAGKDIANPLGAILSAAMLLRYSLGLDDEAAALEDGVAKTIAAGARTADLGGCLKTGEMTDEVLKHL